MNKIFVTGIGTGVGKSVVSAALVQALRANYWKPIQSGTIEGSDTETVASLVSNAS
ncbi:MAG: AAA family ATPase, partial [Bdellovibrionales bacterium]|nr:AAA family ATPase [Bdellovibrionales bacterium]